MSRDLNEIELRLTPEQKKIVRKKFGRESGILAINLKTNIMPLYGILSEGKEIKSEIIKLTDSQKKMIEKKLNAPCDYIEIDRKNMKLR